MNTFRIVTIPRSTAEYLMMLPASLGGYVLLHAHSDLLTSRYLAKLDGAIAEQAGERPVTADDAAAMIATLDKWAARRGEAGVYGRIARDVEGMDKMVRADLVAIKE